MARIRTIKPSFFKHEGLFDAEKETGLPLRVAFAGLWTVADRAGRFAWRPRAIKTDVLPYDEVDMGRVLDALATRGFIQRYEVDATPYGVIPTFEDHQVINNREVKSDIPPPPHAAVEPVLTRDPRVTDASPTGEARDDDASGTTHVRDSHATATRHELAQGEGKGRGKEGESPLPPNPVKHASASFDTGAAFERLVEVWGLDDHRGRAIATYAGLVAKAADPAVLAEQILEGAKLRAAVRTRFTPAEDKRLDLWLAEARWTERPKPEGATPPKPATDAKASERLETVLWWSRKRLTAPAEPWPAVWGPPPTDAERIDADQTIEAAMIRYRDQGQIDQSLPVCDRERGKKPTVAEFEAAVARREERELALPPAQVRQRKAVTA